MASIGEAKVSLLHECEGLTGDLLDLGAQIVDNIDGEEAAMAIFRDKDFQDRTVFNLITVNEFQ